MSHSAQTGEGPGFVRRFAHWWRSWKGRRRAIVDLNGCGPAEVERIARDVGVSGADLSILAGKWPDAADLLYWRMNEINLDRMEITQADPQVMRDFSECARSVAANGGASTSSQTTLPIRRGKDIALTRRRSWHWSPSESPKLRQIRRYAQRLRGGYDARVFAPTETSAITEPLYPTLATLDGGSGRSVARSRAPRLG